MTVTTLQTPRWLLSGKGRQSRLPDQRTQGHIKHLSFQNASRMPVIGVPFQLASKSQTLLTFLGNSCRKRTNIYLFRQAQASFKEQE